MELEQLGKSLGCQVVSIAAMLVRFLLLAVLEDIGYMDRVFRRFGLSGKSFIPMLVAAGCGMPGIMASRTIEEDRKMTIMTTGFIPCGAKMPIVALFAGALFGGSPLVAASAFFIGVGAVVISGIILKKFRAFAGEPAPFVMERLPRPLCQQCSAGRLGAGLVYLLLRRGSGAECRPTPFSAPAAQQV